ncbi:general transcription factor 3C polypeptide 5 isoform X2 [Helicoverpa zea]|uniref:general transcription factor 3C polypeptide 5 isoform X2 n=1 Tax=Helicoverpa zea TaxID=7113 RepID=UPI001F566F59|nr:general transcription factor 3C polypeptide 5 isoform X2 [Helicoverpa zea]
MENNMNRELVGVLFPGIVKNDDKAIACLGGIRNISQVYSSYAKKRLGLSYQPENPFIRKIYSTGKKAAGVLLKVKVKKTRDGTEVKREVVSTTIVGCVKTMFRFESMCDFQYLPVHREGSNDGPLTCSLEKVLPSGLDTIDFMLQPAPLLLIPSSFTRLEKPITYTYTDKRYPDRPDQGDNVHNKTRSLRSSQVAPYTFNLIDDWPSEPHESYVKQKDLKCESSPRMVEEYETVKKLLEERPIWSLNLIRYHTKIRLSSLKIIMPSLALYMKTGPWRSMWVRYGYDPRKDPGARIYQTLDFRLRHAVWYDSGRPLHDSAARGDHDGPRARRPQEARRPRLRGHRRGERVLPARHDAHAETYILSVLRHPTTRSGRDIGRGAPSRVHVPSEARLAAPQHRRDLPRPYVPIR